MPQAELEKEAEALKKWRDKTVITYGSDGSEGANAARMLMKLGFTKVFNLDGGLNGWLKDNMPIVKIARAATNKPQNDPAGDYNLCDGLVSVLPAREALIDSEEFGIYRNQRGRRSEISRRDDGKKRIAHGSSNLHRRKSISAAAMIFSHSIAAVSSIG